MRSNDAAWSAADRRIALLVFPVVTVDLALQFIKIVDRFSELTVRTAQMSAVDWLAFVSSPLLFHLGFALLCCALILTRSRNGFHPGLIFAQLFALVTLLDQLAAFSFFMHTSAPLGFEQVRYWLGRPGDLILTASVVPIASWLGVLALAVWLLLAPRLVRDSKRNDIPRRAPTLVLAVGGIFAGALGFLSLSSQAADLDTARDPTLELIATAFLPRPKLDLPPPRILRIEKTSGETPLNVAIILLESTRAISVEPWGDVPSMPTLAALAKNSLIATRAYTVVPHTSKALIATLCGLDPSHSVDALEEQTGMLSRCLPALLHDIGYQSAFFQSADPYFEGRAQVTQEMGFDQFTGATKATAGQYVRANFVGFEDDVMLEPSRLWLMAHAHVPKLAVYLTVAPHHECYPLARYGRVTFDSRKPVNDYLNNVREEDFFIKNLLDQYKQLGLYENTIFIILGDHGEAFGEHSRRAHDSVPYEEVLRIPLLIHDPSGMLPPSVLRTPVSELDVVPTLLTALHLHVTAGTLSGFAFGHRPAGEPMFASCFGEKDCLVDIRGDRKLITFFGRRPDELYDLADDPRETKNLLGVQTASEVSAMRDELQRWERRVRMRY